jgi:hypothetical protein
MANQRRDETPQNYDMTERQKKGYDEAAHGGPDVPPSDVGVPTGEGARDETESDPAARDAAAEVRRRERSAG